MPDGPVVCGWVSLKEALARFGVTTSGTEAAAHIKPLHWWAACRLVVEGGFRPDEITPRPPFVMRTKGPRVILECDPSMARGGEHTVLGGLKTKVVDVVVAKNGVGPVIAISIKGSVGAFRNLTNRMEEAVGDCTNLHISYPALVYGFLHVIRANREREGVAKNDVALRADGGVSDAICRYHDVLARLAGRSDVRDDATKYEAVALTLVDPDRPATGEIVKAFPSPTSPLLLESFFGTLYRQYDQRFVYAAPGLEATTRRLEWDAESPAVNDTRLLDYEPRIAAHG